jgi:hypothetical protein
LFLFGPVLLTGLHCGHPSSRQLEVVAQSHIALGISVGIVMYVMRMFLCEIMEQKGRLQAPETGERDDECLCGLRAL